MTGFIPSLPITKEYWVSQYVNIHLINFKWDAVHCTTLFYTFIFVSPMLHKDIFNVSLCASSLSIPINFKSKKGQQPYHTPIHAPPDTTTNACQTTHPSPSGHTHTPSVTPHTHTSTPLQTHTKHHTTNPSNSLRTQSHNTHPSPSGHTVSHHTHIHPPLSRDTHTVSHHTPIHPPPDTHLSLIHI